MGSHDTEPSAAQRTMQLVMGQPIADESFLLLKEFLSAHFWPDYGPLKSVTSARPAP